MNKIYSELKKLCEDTDHEPDALYLNSYELKKIQGNLIAKAFNNLFHIELNNDEKNILSHYQKTSYICKEFLESVYNKNEYYTKVNFDIYDYNLFQSFYKTFIINIKHKIEFNNMLPQEEETFFKTKFLEKILLYLINIFVMIMQLRKVAIINFYKYKILKELKSSSQINRMRQRINYLENMNKYIFKKDFSFYQILTTQYLLNLQEASYKYNKIINIIESLEIPDTEKVKKKIKVSLYLDNYADQSFILFSNMIETRNIFYKTLF